MLNKFFFVIGFLTVFVLSSKYEGLPNVLIEAQKYNLPIISTNCQTGPKEILINGKLGELLSPLLTELEILQIERRVSDLLNSGTFPLPSPDWPAVPWPAF